MSSQLTAFDPFADLAPFDPLRNFEALLRGLQMPAGLRQDVPAIRLDVDESEHAFTVNAEIPGVHKDDIKVQVDGNRVAIR